MRALAVQSPGVTEIVDIPRPEINEYECLVNIKACAFCNCTDMEMIYNNHVNISFDYPFILGHEGVGEIVEVGGKVTNYHVGDRVVFPEGRTAQGGYRADSGHYCEYAVVRDLQAMRQAGMDTDAMIRENRLCAFPRLFPSTIAFEDAAVLVPMRETYSAARNIGVKKGSRVLIFGDGPNSFGLCIFSKIHGAEWVGVVGHHQDRLDHIKENGHADLVMNSKEGDVWETVKGMDLDIVIDAVGRTEILIKSSHAVKPGGTVALYSSVHKDQSVLDLYAWANNVSFHKHFFPYGHLPSHDEVISLITSGAVNPADFYSHTVPLEEFRKAMEMTKSREAYKVVVTI